MKRAPKRRQAPPASPTTTTTASRTCPTEPNIAGTLASGKKWVKRGFRGQLPKRVGGALATDGTRMVNEGAVSFALAQRTPSSGTGEASFFNSSRMRDSAALCRLSIISLCFLREPNVW